MKYLFPRTSLLTGAFSAFLFSSLILFFASCKTTGEQKPIPVRQGAVEFFNSIPEGCTATKGIKQQSVARVTSEQALRSHYGLTFQVRFNDGVTAPLYGSLYYQSASENKYCMALPDGRFAVFQDSKVGEKPNVMQEVCYPLQDCQKPGQ